MSAAGGALRKDISLGESAIASGVVAALGLAACSLLALFNFGTRWRLVLELSDGTRAKTGNFRDARIHDIVDELNAFVRSQQSTET